MGWVELFGDVVDCVFEGDTAARRVFGDKVRLCTYDMDDEGVCAVVARGDVLAEFA